MWLVLISLISFCANAESVRVVTFEELPKLIKERNENVKAAENMRMAARERSGYLTRSFLPKISARAGNETFKTRSAPSVNHDYWTVEGRLNVYRGGRDRLESDARRLDEKIATSEVARESNSSLREARQTFWKMVAIKQLLRDREAALQKNEDFIKSSRRRSGAGVATNADTIQFELNKTRLEQELKKMTLEQDMLRNRLSVLLGFDEHENLQVTNEFPHPPENKEEFAALKADQNLEVRIANDSEARDRIRATKEKRWWTPHVDLYSTYGLPSPTEQFTRGQQNEVQYSLGVQMGIDLGGALESRSDAAARAYEAEAQKNRARLKLREVVANDHEIRHDLNLLHGLIHDADRDITKAESFLKLTISEYQRGVKNGPDLLGAFQSLYEFKERRTALYQEFHETRAALLDLLAEEGT